MLLRKTNKIIWYLRKQQFCDFLPFKHIINTYPQESLGSYKMKVAKLQSTSEYNQKLGLLKQENYNDWEI